MTARRLLSRQLHALALLVLGLCLGAGSLAAQASDSLFQARRGSPFVVKYGKWLVLAGAVGMGLKASSAHHDADRAFDRLEDYCFEDQDRCDQRPDGSYLDPVAERHYQRAITRDRHARGWLLGGEVALLGAAGMFVWELTRPKGGPDNIPFEPQMRWDGRRTRLGLNIPF
jgi:hypothetical protein